MGYFDRKIDRERARKLARELHAEGAESGVWEAILSAGPTVSFAAEREDVAKYLAVFEELVAVLAE